MPISYERDDTRRLITVTFTEPPAYEELLGIIERQSAEGTWDYALLYDGRAIAFIATSDVLQEFRAHVVRIGAGRPRGPVGIRVPPQTQPFQVGLAYSKITSGLLDVEILITPEQVDAWLARNTRKHGS